MSEAARAQAVALVNKLAGAVTEADRVRLAEAMISALHGEIANGRREITFLREKLNEALKAVAALKKAGQALQTQLQDAQERVTSLQAICRANGLLPFERGKDGAN